MSADEKDKSTTAAFERMLKEGASSDDGQYVLRLYVAGNTAASARAITNLKRICTEHLEGRYVLEVIDLYQQPKLAAGDQIVAAPTLVKRLPEPLRRVIGDMSDTAKVLVGLDLKPGQAPDE